MSFSIVKCLICDDVRREITNKDIIIGAYANGINVPSFPAQINLCIWMVLKSSISGPISFDIKLDFPGTDDAPQLKMHANVSDPNSNFAVSTPHAVFNIVTDGMIVASLLPPNSKKWVKLEEIQISLGR